MLTSASEFCELLRNDIGSVSMVVRIVNEMIFDLDRAEDIEVDVADERSIPLVEVLERNCLGPQSKLLLAYTLAKSVWQFYDSDFMRIYWTTESIHLFEEKEREEEDDDESENDEGGRERSVDWAPYYAFPFEDMREVETVERLPLGKFIHRYPHVLALGLLLYELGLKRRSKKRIKPGEPATTPEKRINDNAKRIRTGVTSDKWPNIGLKHPESLEKYRIIVANCASESVFRPPTTEDATKTPLQMEEELHIEERRAMLYRKVVVPLKELLRDAGWINESGNIARQLVKGDNAMSKKCHISKDSVSETLLANTSQSFEVAPNGIQQASTVSMKAEAWLENIKRSSLAKELHSQFQNNGVLASKRIRIAVLDTGYDPDAIFFNRERKKRLKGWRDFTVKAQPVGKDEDGHGTHVLSVLMQVAATADIYVARVARDTSELQYSTQNVANMSHMMYAGRHRLTKAKAIEWAWKCCGANIISMSFGFDDEIYVDDKPVISNAIYKALQKTNQQILFFAAAANDGGNRPEMFPANSPQVFSIRGSDDTGWQQPFNPPPDYDASTCFMTLGKDVPGASLSASKHKGANVCKSGTSVATPIAAGIAAILLGYARIHEKELCQSLQFQHDIMLLSLWKMSGMREMFKNIATTMVDKWAYLSLSKFIKQSQGLA
ncbi:Peptidase S8/S53, subtilisin/kexin/sedolisin [Beauveria bassiana ARSEF 2860]|uniref:Peptidase S8/S53, subtilisin/kexin/sedolisin n=1 Tax=Beauveria bassiana (strain ARSEF 2860) TaxID=655819 RepID=J4VYY1_BEAB2|nr:Peptidase S8/S53, subtilisin/kexin/sedolisin [Beauveria bassiana ARSEF 2860]EJP63535.1 Peptidase S8/S53, subtilisin/kexin/sedolisin [Beauveria bassiana ARSEF 2860]